MKWRMVMEYLGWLMGRGMSTSSAWMKSAPRGLTKGRESGAKVWLHWPAHAASFDFHATQGSWVSTWHSNDLPWLPGPVNRDRSTASLHVIALHCAYKDRGNHWNTSCWCIMSIAWFYCTALSAVGGAKTCKNGEWPRPGHRERKL